MFLHIGGEVMVPLNELIAIIDLETGRRREVNCEFLNFAAGEKQVVHVGRPERGKSIVVTKRRIYYSPISVDTLTRRSQLQIAGRPERNRRFPCFFYWER